MLMWLDKWLDKLVEQRRHKKAIGNKFEPWQAIPVVKSGPPPEEGKFFCIPIDLHNIEKINEHKDNLPLPLKRDAEGNILGVRRNTGCETIAPLHIPPARPKRAFNSHLEGTKANQIIIDDPIGYEMKKEENKKMEDKQTQKSPYVSDKKPLITFASRIAEMEAYEKEEELEKALQVLKEAIMRGWGIK